MRLATGQELVQGTASWLPSWFKLLNLYFYLMLFLSVNKMGFMNRAMGRFYKKEGEIIFGSKEDKKKNGLNWHFPFSELLLYKLNLESTSSEFYKIVLLTIM